MANQAVEIKKSTTVSIAVVLVLLGLVVGVISWTTSMSDRVSAQSIKIAKQDKKIAHQQQKLASILDIVQSNQVNIAKNQTKLVNIYRVLGK